VNKNIAETLGRFIKPQQPTLSLITPVPDGLIPQPLPTLVGTTVMDGTDNEGKRTQWIGLQFSTPQGVNFFMLPISVAQEVADNIATAVRQAKSGLVVPPQ
jgi:hypothetical protein